MSDVRDDRVLRRLGQRNSRIEFMDGKENSTKYHKNLEKICCQLQDSNVKITMLMPLIQSHQ